MARVDEGEGQGRGWGRGWGKSVEAVILPERTESCHFVQKTATDEGCSWDLNTSERIPYTMQGSPIGRLLPGSFGLAQVVCINQRCAAIAAR